jgi:hypothetical protein
MNDLKRYRLYLKGLHVGITVRAERVEFDAPTLYFWNDCVLVASFWLADVTELRDADGVALKYGDRFALAA